MQPLLCSISAAHLVTQVPEKWLGETHSRHGELFYVYTRDNDVCLPCYAAQTRRWLLLRSYLEQNRQEDFQEGVRASGVPPPLRCAQCP